MRSSKQCKKPSVGQKLKKSSSGNSWLFVDFAPIKSEGAPNFDRELPPEVRAELVPPRRPRILKRPAESVPIGLILLALVVVILTAGGLWIILWQAHEIQQSPDAAPQATPTPSASMHISAVQPAPLLVSSPDDERFFPSEVRRAERVGLQVRMPYGEVVHIRILGTLPDQESLPMSGNHIGDTYHVGDFEFTWVAPDGIGQWIDP